MTMWDSTEPPIGVITGTEARPIRYDDWVALIRIDGRLQLPAARERVSPRTGLSRVIQPNPSIALLVHDGVEVGLMGWSEEEGVDEVVVYGASPHVVDVATDVAAALGGEFHVLDPDELEMPPKW